MAANNNGTDNIILSLSAKTVLCWLIWTGTLAPV
jgi:hypothetical protein